MTDPRSATARLSVPAADGLLLFTALIWGVGFVAQRIAARDMGDTPFTFNAARFAVGTLCLVPMLIGRRGAFSFPAIAGGIAAGLAMAIASSLQQAAMSTVTAGTAGFITGTYVIWTPIIGIALGQRAGARVWIGAACALAGLWILGTPPAPAGSAALTGATGAAPATDVSRWIPIHLSRGELLVLGCAIAWAFHVHIIGWAAHRADAFGVSFIQFVCTALASATFSIALEEPTLEMLHAGLWPIIFSGIFAIALAFTLQVVAQGVAPPAHAAIILSLESVFAELSGGLFLNEGFDRQKWLGAGLMFAGALIATVTGLRPARPQSPPDRQS
jgi:drug/metabolite transporter (DMT)-like permease